MQKEISAIMANDRLDLQTPPCEQSRPVAGDLRSGWAPLAPAALWLAELRCPTPGQSGYVFGVLKGRGGRGGAPSPQSVLRALGAGCDGGQTAMVFRAAVPRASCGQGRRLPSNCLSASLGAAQRRRDPSLGQQKGLGQTKSQVAWSCRAMPREAPASAVLQRPELPTWSPAGLSRSGCSAWCWVLGPRHRGQSWGAAAIPSGRARVQRPGSWLGGRSSHRAVLCIRPRWLPWCQLRLWSRARVREFGWQQGLLLRNAVSGALAGNPRPQQVWRAPGEAESAA